MGARLPEALRATGTLSLGTHRVPRAFRSFTPYPADGSVHTFGGKDLLLVDGRPQFAEVAILRLFEAAGWEGRWVETYPYRKNPRFWRAWNPEGPQAQAHVPIAEPWVRERLQAIAAANGGYFSGCWDVVAWKDGRLVFAESKRAKRDRLRGTQLRWLGAAIRCGLCTEDFLVVEWALA
jgi:hypothetical protein